MLALVLFLAGCGAPDPNLKPAAKPSGTILFVSDGHIAKWNGKVTQITKDGQAASPRWTAIGDRIAYIDMHADEGWSDLIIARPNGETLRQVTNNRPEGQAGTHQFVRSANWAADPAWSPAGDQLAYVSDRDGWEPGPNEERYSDPLYIWYAESSDGDPYVLPRSADIGLTQSWPTFSPDGLKLAFGTRVSTGDGNMHTEIDVIELESGNLTPLVTGVAAYAPAWSPDGKTLAFIERTEQGNNVWLMPAAGGDAYQLTETGDCTAPVWSPDGQFLAFFRASDVGSIAAWDVELSTGADGRITASEPHKLFSADNIDTTSGMSWSAVQ